MVTADRWLGDLGYRVTASPARDLSAPARRALAHAIDHGQVGGWAKGHFFDKDRASSPGRETRGVYRIIQSVAQLKVRGFEVQLPGFDLREIQDIVQKP